MSDHAWLATIATCAGLLVGAPASAQAKAADNSPPRPAELATPSGSDERRVDVEDQRARARAWAECTPGIDCARDDVDDLPADRPVALGMTLEMVFRDVDDELFVKDIPALRLGAVLMVDFLRFEMLGPTVLALDLGYRLEQSSASELFDGVVTTALTSHEPYVGLNLRVLSDRGIEPLFSYHGRLVGGLAFGPLELRDARGDSRDLSGSAAAFFDAGVGFTLRPLGLLFETGYELAWPRHFVPEGTSQRWRVERHGWYARTGVLLRFP
jgi:hypothetical protein